MPGPNPSDNPHIDYTSLDAVLRLLANAEKFNEEIRRANELYIYLLKLQGWKNDTDQRVANKLPLQPPPIPPSFYKPPEVPPVEIKLLPEIVFQPKNQWGQYTASNDTQHPVGYKYMVGTITLVKVKHETPFGTAYWWEETK